MKPNRPDPDGTTKVAPTANREACPGDYEFGPFQLDSRTHLLYREGKVVHLTPKVLEVLFVLVEARGQLVEKHQLIEAVWPNCFVEEGNLSQTISILRKSLGEISDGGQYIETIPTRGYRVSAPIENSLKTDSALADPTDGPSKTLVWRWTKRSAIAIGVLLVALLATALLIRRQKSAIVDSLGENVQPTLRGSKVKHYTSSSEAYDLYLKGLYQKGKVSRAAMDKAIGLFKQAIALDPEFAAPHAGLAHSYIALGYSFQIPPREAYPQALKEVRKALAIDDSLADANGTPPLFISHSIGIGRAPSANSS